MLDSKLRLLILEADALNPHLEYQTSELSPFACSLKKPTYASVEGE